MTSQNLLGEFTWLINTIRNAGRITFADLQQKWLRSNVSNGRPLQRSTFNRHRDAIRELYNVYIDCDLRTYQYYISNSEVFNEDTVQNWVITTLTVNNIMGDGLAVQDRILLEQIPCDRYLETVISAMKNKVRLQMSYLRYGKRVASQVVVEPYCLKLFNRRWYLLAHIRLGDAEGYSFTDRYVVYAFDRIQSLTPTDEKFELLPDFNAQTFFSECFGVVAGDGTPAETIHLRVFGVQRHYLRDLPLHHTQRLVRQREEYDDYELQLRPTIDFCNHLLSLGSSVKVLKPKKLATHLCQMMEETLALYRK